MGNDDFAKHAKAIYPRGLREGQNPLFGEGWYSVWLKKYDGTHGAAAQTAIRKIIDRYYPSGRPTASRQP
ncbi:MAG: hypothetical protein FJX72_05845 [Armatimonadetes bacterium]|nr:hypothetical protein [Armatimonadota bacterium]